MKNPEKSFSLAVVMILSSDGRKGKILKDVLISEEKQELPVGQDSFLSQLGRQIDPYLVATAEIQQLQKRIENLLEKEKQLRVDFAKEREHWVKERRELEREQEELRQQMSHEAEMIREKECRKGFEKGYSEGLKKASKEMDQKYKKEYQERFERIEITLQEVLKQLENSAEKNIEKNSAQMIRLWQLILGRLLRREVELDEEAVLRLFREIIHRVSDWSSLKLFLNPDDRELFLSRGQEITEIKRVADHFEIISDENIEKGSCLLETNLGVYDARWGSQLEAVEREIDGLVREIFSDDDQSPA